MHPDQIALVQQSWPSLAADADAFAAVFYDRLFALDPSTTALFAHTELRAQGGKVTQTLAVVVRGLENLVALLPAVRALGARHAGYGVRDEHYATVGAALRGTIAGLLAERADTATLDAWTAAYTALADAMLEAARHPALVQQAADRTPAPC